MQLPYLSGPLLAIWSCFMSIVVAEQVLSTVIYTNHGERTPMVWIDDPSLTPLGARQLWQAGINMRNRYVRSTSFGDETSYTIRGISSIFLKSREINILSTTDEWVAASAQAFMQGLYPPLTDGQNYTNIEGESKLANGTEIVSPLGGYQYPNVVSASSYDLRSVYVKGTDNCPNYDNAMADYYTSPEYQASEESARDFYDSLKEPLLRGVFDDSAVGYYDAYYIWDYLSYGVEHNITVARKLSYEDQVKARLLAGNWMLEMYANTTNGEVAKDHIRAIAGRTLASYVMQSFTTSIQTRGRVNKMNLMFGDYKPMMSFAALAELMKERTGAFFLAPAPGASIIFELFTTEPESESTPYPKTTDMKIRFYYQDGNSTDPVEYPLFNRSPSQSTMSYAEFVSYMSGIQISDVEDWCRACNSGSLFCTAVTSGNNSGFNNRHGLKPAVAGVIGAICALAFIALVIGLVMLLGRIRFYRQDKRNSHLGGFKGNEKLASDRDLTLPKGGAGVTVNEEVRGHERVGSWELREPVNYKPGIDTAAFGNRSHGLDNDDTKVDPYADPVRPRDVF